MATSRVCSIPGCGKPHAARSLCDPHFRRWKKSGDSFDRSPVIVVERAPICVIDGCDKPHSAFGYCANHYRSWQKHGDPLAAADLKCRKNARLEFLENIAKVATDDCVLWPYALDTHGYGQFHIKKKCHRAHRVICELAHGEASSPELQAAHSCGVRSCINPRHIRWATPIENSADRLVHGTTIRGSQVQRARLKEADIPVIRARLRAGDSTLQISRAFGVSDGAIQGVKSGKTWAWLHDSYWSPGSDLKAPVKPASEPDPRDAFGIAWNKRQDAT